MLPEGVGHTDAFVFSVWWFSELVVVFYLESLRL